jgi:rhodanese-related sulfurtransferase
MGRTLRELAILLAAGLICSVLALAVGGRVSWSDLPPLTAALEEQIPVYSWDVRETAARLGAELLIVDGRSPESHEASRPAESVNVPFEERNEGLFQLPQGRQVHAVLVVMEEGEAARARQLAKTLARQWGIAEVATLQGGWQAWFGDGLPRAEG